MNILLNIENAVTQLERETIIFCKVHEFVKNFNETSGYTMPIPAVLFSKRMTTTGATASYKPSTGEMTLKFSSPILMNPNNDFDHYVRQVVAHEFAHLVDYVIRGTSDHGPIFKNNMMKYCGSEYSDTGTCHSFEVTRRKTKKYTINCPCGEVLQATAVRINKMRRDGVQYRLRCGNLVNASHIGELVA